MADTQKRTLTCIGCPMGCPLTVTLSDGAVQSVAGNTCPRGDAYARSEVTHPTRTVTTSAAVWGSKTGAVTVSCKTAQAVPKETVFDVVRALKGVAVPAPVKIGDVILKDAAGTGVAVIATKNVE